MNGHTACVLVSLYFNYAILFIRCNNSILHKSRMIVEVDKEARGAYLINFSGFKIKP